MKSNAAILKPYMKAYLKDLGQCRLQKENWKIINFFFLYLLDTKALKSHFTVLNFTKKTWKSITRTKKRPVVLRRYCILSTTLNINKTMALEQQLRTLPFMSMRLLTVYNYVAYKAWNDHDIKWRWENVITW